MYLLLPLADKRTHNFQMTVLHVGSSKVPTQYCVTLPNTGQHCLLKSASCLVLQVQDLFC